MAISLEVNAGEILGIAGVAGNGQDELFAVLSGEVLAGNSGDIVIDGHAAGVSPINAGGVLGAAFVPEERLGHATAPRMPLSDNALLTGHAAATWCGIRSCAKARCWRRSTRRPRRSMSARAERDPEAVSLSGGNLQKFVVGREILREPGVLVVSQPTWGVDAGAAATIRQALIDLAARGSAVLVISQDLDELHEISDRIAVMFRGRSVAADRGRVGGPRNARHADGRRNVTDGERACWCLSGAPNVRSRRRCSRR